VAEVQDDNGLLGGAVSVGDTVTGVFVYDTTAATNGSTTATTSCDVTTGVGVVNALDGLTFRSDPNNVNFHLELDRNVKDAAGNTADTFLFGSSTNLPLNSQATVDRIAWQVDNPGSTTLQNHQLPVNTVNLGKWRSVYGLTFEGHDANNQDSTYLIRAHLFSISQVPNGTLP